jgi:hypothetical protein
MSGQVPELYPVIRTCIENALYCVHFNRNPAAFQVWQSRNDSDASLKQVKTAFQVSKVLASLQAADRGLHGRVARFHEELIDLGAHPNQLGLFGNMTMNETPEAIHFDTTYLVGDSEQLRLALKRCAQAGLMSLDMIRLVFKERCDLLGLSGKLPPLQKDL